MRTPKGTRDWEETAALLAKAGWTGTPLATPCAVVVEAVHPRPKRKPKHIIAPLWARGGRVPRPSVPDVDNVIKAVCDALQLGGVLADDRWVVEVTGRSWYAAVGEKAHVQVTVHEIEEE